MHLHHIYFSYPLEAYSGVTQQLPVIDNALAWSFKVYFRWSCIIQVLICRQIHEAVEFG